MNSLIDNWMVLEELLGFHLLEVLVSINVAMINAKLPYYLIKNLPSFEYFDKREIEIRVPEQIVNVIEIEKSGVNNIFVICKIKNVLNGPLRQYLIHSL